MANSISILVQAKDAASATLANVSKNIEKTGEAGEQSATRLQNLEKGLIPLAGLTAAAGVGFKKMTEGVGESVDEANRLQNALTGLSTIAGYFNQDVNEANAAARRLASDGLMTVTESATGLKNLLASGFSLPEAITLMERFKDSAAFNRQAALGFGQAISGATEGIKNGNSILVDNAGVTKNLSVILEEAGYSAQDLNKATSDVNIRQALYQGILKETNPMVGDSKKLADQFAGAQAKLAAETDKTQQQLGKALQPALKKMMDVVTPLVVKVGEWIEKHPKLAAGIVIVTTSLVGLVALVGAAGTAVVVLGQAYNALGIATLAMKTGTLAAAAAQGTLNAVMLLNPYVAVAAAAVLIVGAYANLVMNSDRAGSASQRLKAAQEALTAAQRDAKVAQDALSGALLDEEGAQLRVESAKRRTAEALAQYGSNSLEYRQAVYDEKRANDDLANAQANVIDKTKGVVDAKQRVIDQEAAVKKSSESIKNSVLGEAGAWETLGNKIGAAREAAGGAKNGTRLGDNVQIPKSFTPGNRGFALGTPYAPGGLTMVGENGPELVNLPRGSQVTPAWQTRGQQGGMGDIIINITGPVSMNNESNIDYFAQRISATQRLAAKGMAS